MTFAELEEIVAKVRFCGMWRDARVSAYLPSGTDEVQIRFFATVPERDSGNRVSLNHIETFEPVELLMMKPPQLLWFIHRAWLRFTRHEADEAFKFDGQRPFDPHRNERPNHGQPMNPSGGAGDDAPAPYGLAQTNTPSSAGPRERVPATRISPTTLPPGAPGPTRSGSGSGP